MVFYGLALVFNYPHFMATIYRAYGTREDFSKYRVFTVHATALLILTAILTHTSLKLLPWVFTLYINWSPWHYSGQNYGLLMMFARRNEAGDAATAAPLLDRARTQFEAIGMSGWIRRADELASHLKGTPDA